jgi:DNA-binding GntR family transcriptional regulator
LMDAVVDRDADRAARLIRTHFERTAELVRQVLSHARRQAIQIKSPAALKRKARA